LANILGRGWLEQKDGELFLEKCIQGGHRRHLVFLFDGPITGDKIGAEIGFLFVGFPDGDGFPTLVMYGGIEKLAILACMQILTTMFAAVRSLYLVDQFDFASAGVTTKHIRAAGCRSAQPSTSAKSVINSLFTHPYKTDPWPTYLRPVRQQTE
jgi:hypothetical protein